jgi:isopenicillin N synthase-like dioxygenase
MATSFTSLPIIDLSPLKESDPFQSRPSPEIVSLAKQLHDAFATSGFAYLSNLPLSYTHEDVFGLSKRFFSLPDHEKMRLAKHTFVKENDNTYRGYTATTSTDPFTSSDTDTNQILPHTAWQSS